MAITTAIPPTDRATSDQLVPHSRLVLVQCSGLLLRLTNGLAAVSTKERKGGDGRWIEGGSKSGPFFRGTRALPPRCCTHDALQNLQMAKSCRNSVSLELEPSAEGGRQRLFRKCFLPDLPLGHICGLTTGCLNDILSSLCRGM